MNDLFSEPTFCRGVNRVVFSGYVAQFAFFQQTVDLAMSRGATQCTQRLELAAGDDGVGGKVFIQFSIDLLVAKCGRVGADG